MNLCNPHPKIGPQHLGRKAIVYVRQSSLKQVKENLASQHLQYALVTRARDLGFDQVEVIDSDLGFSAAMAAERRVGFDLLVSAVARREVGLILSREASRLSRTDQDWCRLLEVCQVFDTLIGDDEQVYDLSLIDDQLVMGIKGTLSVVELKVLKMRMQQGREEKARRGELVFRLGPGYIWDAEGKVVKDPDERVQNAVSSIFDRFRETWSMRQTYLWFHDHEVELPCTEYRTTRGVRLTWKLPTHCFINQVLKNPFYAGAYVYGRRSRETFWEDGSLRHRMGSLRKAEDCRVFIRDHHEGYISWKVFEENQTMIQSNEKGASDGVTAAVRKGQGLLQGLLRCGHCGRRLHVRYNGRSGTSPRYFCKGDYDTSGGSYCLGFGGRAVDERVGEEVIRLLSPLGIDASLAAVNLFEERTDEKRKSLELELEQLDYQVQRAFEQYDEADPRNRLVASELEHRWNSKMEIREKVRDRLAVSRSETISLSPKDKAEIDELGRDFARVWNDLACPIDIKKRIVRTVLQECVVTLGEDKKTLHFVLHWTGGAHSQLELDRPLGAFHQRTTEEAHCLIQKMADAGFGDDDIASVLNKHGLRTGKKKRWNQNRVGTARRSRKIEGRLRTPALPDFLSLQQAADHCESSHHAVRTLVKAGLVQAEQVVPYAPWRIRKADLAQEAVQKALRGLRKTGRLALQGGRAENQGSLFV